MVFVLVFSILEFFRLDLDLADFFYDASVERWPWRDHWLTKTVLHDWGQIVDMGLGALALSVLLLSRFIKPLRPYSKMLLFLFIASVTGPALIAVLKNSTHIYCPWDLSLFGGDKPYVRLFDFASYPAAIGHCFPAAHAGGGYALLSLYFFLLLIKPEYRFAGLFSGLFLGLVFGITQQMRGAHFLSHDVFSLAICWFSSLILFVVLFWRDVQWK